MSDTIAPTELVLAAAMRVADGLCEHLEGVWQRASRAEQTWATAAIKAGDLRICVLGLEVRGEGRLRFSGIVPAASAEPAITVRADRPINVIAREITRRLLPAMEAERVKARLAQDREAQHEAARAAIIDHFMDLMPHSRRDPYAPTGAAKASSDPGLGLFSADITAGWDGWTADLHLRDAPVGLISSIVELIGHSHAEQRPGDWLGPDQPLPPPATPDAPQPAPDTTTPTETADPH